MELAWWMSFSSTRERRCPFRFCTGRTAGRSPEALIHSAGGDQEGDGTIMGWKCDTVLLVGSTGK